MSQQGGVNMRGMGWAMMLAVFLGGLASFWAALHLQYGAGVNVMTNHNWQFRQVEAWSSLPVPPDFWGRCGSASAPSRRWR